MRSSVKPKEHLGHTSVNLALHHIEALKAAAMKHDLSENDLMILLLRFANEHSLAVLDKQPRVKYQEPGLGFRIVNLYIGQRDYERNIDSRRYGKISVSCLLAYAIDHFLDVVIQKIITGLAHGIKVLNNYIQPQITLIKKSFKRIKMVSIWYPMRA